VLVVDDILLFPVRGLLFIFREIHRAAQEEFASEGEAIRAELSELYMMLETAGITEEEFDARERELLGRLDGLEGNNNGSDSW
jgi:hypothetical protein